MAPSRNDTSHSMLLAHIGAAICVVMWGVSFVSTKVLLNLGMQPVEIYIYRFALAYLLIWALKRTRLFSHSWRDEGLLLLCGLLAGSIYYLAENFALRYTLVTNVSLLTSTSPLITALLVMTVYKSENTGTGTIVGSSVALLGVAMVIFNSSFAMQLNPLGDILALAAAFSWALYSLILKQLNVNYDVWFITRKTFLYGILTTLPFLYIEPPKFTLVEFFQCPDAVINILFLGVGASLIAYLLWAATVKKMGAIKANNYMYFQPIVTLAVSVIALGENLSIVGIIGCLLIIGGLWLGDYINNRQYR